MLQVVQNSLFERNLSDQLATRYRISTKSQCMSLNVLWDGQDDRLYNHSILHKEL
ncbi:MAG: hypothetical protein ACFFDW_10445 [Candidatus Thorarchaeota archaeon]